MTISPVERPVASAAYSFVRFIGGGLAPYVAGRLVLALNIHVPFFIAAGVVAAGIVILTTVHRMLAEAERVQAEQVTAQPATAVATAGQASGQIVPVPSDACGGRHRGASHEPGSVVLAAVDDTPLASLVTEAAAQLAAKDGLAVHVVHAREAAVGGDVAVDGEDLASARALVRRGLGQLAAHQVAAEGQILLHAADHGAAGRIVAEYANAVRAAIIVIGAPSHGQLSAGLDESMSHELLRTAQSNVLIVNPDAPLSFAAPPSALPAAASN
jgi:nucleotide-binding universal stress UspA family protein